MSLIDNTNALVSATTEKSSLADKCSAVVIESSGLTLSNLSMARRSDPEAGGGFPRGAGGLNFDIYGRSARGEVIAKQELIDQVGRALL